MKKPILILLITLITITPIIAEETTTEAPQATEETTEPIEETKESAKDIQTTTIDPPAAPESGIFGSLSPFLAESFQVDSATGSATMSVPITVPPGRKNMQPSVALSYSSNNSNGICGVGWAIPTSSIQRSTKKGVPTYNNADDTFIFSGAELVNIGGNEYRAKIEGAFMRYVYTYTPNPDNSELTINSWTVYDKSGTKYTFGSNTRLENGTKTFSWYLDEVKDVYENYITYTYTEETGQIYLETINYTGGTDLEPNKSIEFIYDKRENDTGEIEDFIRPDKLYSYRTGWNITTGKILSFIDVKLKSSDAEPNYDLIWRYKLDYITSGDTNRSLLQKITVFDAEGNSLPPKTFTYQSLD